MLLLLGLLFIGEGVFFLSSPCIRLPSTCSVLYHNPIEKLFETLLKLKLNSDYGQLPLVGTVIVISHKLFATLVIPGLLVILRLTDRSN